MSQRELHKGTCVGGPMAGMQGMSRFPKGFVLIDAPGERVWVYDRDPQTSTYVAREEDELDEDKAAKAAAEFTYDVRAYDPGVMAE